MLEPTNPFLTSQGDGILSSVNSTAHSMCESISNDTCYSNNGTSTCMTINNNVTCAIKTPEDDDSETLAPYLIAVIVILVLLLFVAIVVFVLWKSSLAKAKIHASEQQGNHYYGNTSAGDALFSEETLPSLKFREESTGTAPVSSNIGGINTLQTEEIMSRNGNLNHGEAPVLVPAKSPRRFKRHVARLTKFFESSTPIPKSTEESLPL